MEEKKKALQNEIEELQVAREELQFVLDRHRAACRMQQTLNINSSRPNSPPDIKPIVYHHLLESTDPMNQIRIKEELDVPTTISSTIPIIIDDNTLMFSDPQQDKQQKMLTNNNSNTTTLNALNTLPHQQQTHLQKPNRPNSLNVPGTLPFKVLTTSASIETIAGIPITTPSAGIPFNFDSLMEGGTGLTPVSGPLVPSCSSQQRNGNTNLNGDLITPESTCPSKLVSL